MSRLEALGISKTYIGPDGLPVEVLEDAEMNLAAGGIHAIVGASGCGKSTFLMICGALLHPNSGSVRIAGQDPFILNGKGQAIGRAGLLGYVFQNYHLIPYLTIEENILASTLTMSDVDMSGECAQITEELGLDHRRNHKPGQLSAGEQQRVAIARALLCRPKVLIADEPTGSLDTTNSKSVMIILRSYADKGGLVLLATHNPTVAGNADTISTIINRKIVQVDQE
jgi:ABC-type lipoprotein export system ATPase subunit